MAKRQLKQLTFDYFDDLMPKKKCNDVEGSGQMDCSGECSLYERDRRSDRRDSSEDSDPESDSESNDTIYDYASDDNDSDSFTDHGHHANESGIWHNSITVDQHSSNSTVTIVNNQSSVLTKSKSNCASLLPASTSTCSTKNKVIPVVPSDIAASANQSPVQPILQYPVTIVSGKRRSFNSLWYKKYHWLEYSREKDAVYCFPCRFFGTCNGLGRGTSTFTQVGFCDWKHATGKSGMLVKHNNSFAHKQAISAWFDYQTNSKRGTLIEDRVDSQRRQQIQSNRHYLKTLAEILLLCGKQDIPLRGHREHDPLLNRGNFLEILQTVALHDQIIKEKIETGPRNAIYTSPGIQNTMLKILGDMIRKSVCDGVKEAKMFSLLVDEAKDVSKTEQVSIVVRFVDIKGSIREHFLTFIDTASLTAEGLTKHIFDILEKFQLDPQWIVAQCYDGASVMSGHLSGVQSRVKEVVPHAHYVHCYAHTLNLVLVDSVKILSSATEFFLLLQTLYSLVSTTKIHSIFVSKQKELHPDKQPYQLQKLCNTRWACRYAAVNAICRTYDAILATLELVGDGPDSEKAIEAKGLYHQIARFSFLLSLVTFDKVLICTKGLSDQLQNSDLDLSQAADLVVATKSTLQEFRSNAYWEKLFQYAKSIAELHNIEVQPLSETRQKRLPKRFENCIVLETTGSRDDLSCRNSYKTKFYFPVIDTFLSEISRRFNEKNIKIMHAIQACNPLAKNFLVPHFLLPLVELYGLDKEMVELEAKLAKRTLENKDITNTQEVYSNLLSLCDAFPELLKLLRISMTIAISTASCERSFSSLKRIKSYLRSTMSEQRLTDLAIISIERELSNSISLDEAIHSFSQSDRRIALS